MFRARALRSFSFSHLDKSAFTESFMHDLPALGITPPPEYADLPKVGFFRSMYECFHDYSIVCTM